ncbi:MAG: Uma2 family endonuclease, partial [Myxococcota bacterium]
TLHMAPLPTIAHQRIASRLLIVLGAYLADNPLGEVFTSNTKVVLDERTCIGPDLVFLARERFGLLRHDGIHGPPDLVVEILSSKPDLDRVVKFAKCQQAGVAHYWLLDPEARTAETFELREGAYAMVARIGSGDRLETALFPGLIIESDHLWRP